MQTSALKEIKEDVNGNTMCPWVGKSSIIKKAVLPKLVYIFNTIPIKILAAFHTYSKKLIVNSYEYKAPRIAKGSLKKKNKFGLSVVHFKKFTTKLE